MRRFVIERFAADDRVALDTLAVWLFPIMVVSVACNQPRPMPLVMAIGQCASIASIACALLIIVLGFSLRVWPALLFGIVLVLRGARLVFPESASLETTYTIAAAILFSAAGCVIAIRRPGLLARQFIVLCAISVPLLLAQIIGIPWTQVLRTDADPLLGLKQIPTLFMPAETLLINPLQARPASVFHANNVTSIITLLGVGLYYGGLPRDRRSISWADASVLAVIVLLMAKLTFLGIAVALAFRLSLGSAARRHALMSAGVLATMLFSYHLLFPGLFAFNLSPGLAWLNLQVRIADLLLATQVPALVAVARQFSPLVLDKIDMTGASQSGYATLAAHAACLLPTVLVSLPYMYFAGRAFKRFDEQTRTHVLFVGTMGLLIPLITSYLGSFMFWFLTAIALLPVWRMVDPEGFDALLPSRDPNEVGAASPEQPVVGLV